MTFRQCRKCHFFHCHSVEISIYMFVYWWMVSEMLWADCVWFVCLREPTADNVISSDGTPTNIRPSVRSFARAWGINIFN